MGTWTYVSLEVGGQKAPEEAAKEAKMTMTFAADAKFNAKVKGKIEGTYKLDPAKKPKEITFTDNEGKVRNAIYKLDGDALTLCQPEEDGAGRPTEVATKEGAKVFLIVLKREKK